MTNVYLLYPDEYDAELLAVASSREQALKWIDYAESGYVIEEHVVDDPPYWIRDSGEKANEGK